ncbi:MAG TPA: hypothetical protein VGO57_10065 [Verrucomicrobiae bacterium]
MIFILFVGLIVAGAIANAIMARKRQEALLGLAQRLNLDFDPRQNFAIPGRFDFLKQLDQGDNRYAINLLSGSYQQNEILAFDYHYETYSTDDKGNQTTHHHWFSFFILMLPVMFPDLTIRREGFFTKIATLFGYQDIQFESAEFSKTFCVRSPDKKFAYDVCHARMMEYLLANRDLSLEIENDVIALAFSDRISAEAFEFNLQRLNQIRSLVPEYLFAKTL